MPNATSACKRIDGRTLEFQNKANGKPGAHIRMVLSSDGKTFTLTQTGKSAVQGNTVNNVIVYQKQ